MKEFLANLFGKEIGTIVMSFVPLIELKGGIVFARSVDLGFFSSLGLAYLGSTLAFFLIFFLLRPILNLLKKIGFIGGFANKVESYFQDKSQEVLQERQKKNSNSKINQTLLKQIGVFIFVAIPLPMTGVWTGTAIAVFLNLKFKDAVLPVTVGNLVAGIIISLLSELCFAIWQPATAKLVLDIFLYVLFALALVLLVVFIIKVLRKKKKEAKN